MDFSLRSFWAENIKILAWKLSSIVAAIAFVAWAQDINWQFSDLSVYQIFPLFGLLAFSLIWSMYAVAFLVRNLKIESGHLKKYFKIMSLSVLAAILIHPGLLWWQLWRDGFGLPPQSYLQHYVAPSLKWAVLLGTTTWLVFIAYEFKNKYRNRSWWRYMEYLADAGLVAIFFHGLALGGELQKGWFRYVWYFYGLVLAVILIDIYRRKYQKIKN